MTSLYRAKVKCACGENNIIVYYASICTWMDDQGLIKDLLEGRLNGSECKKCGASIYVNSTILINSIKNMFSINPRDDPENLKKSLKEYGLIREDGTIVDEFTERLNKVKEEKKFKYPPASSLNASNSVKPINRMKKPSNYPFPQVKSGSTNPQPPPPSPPFSDEAIKERQKEFEKTAANKKLSPSDKEKLKEYLERKQKSDFNRY